MMARLKWLLQICGLASCLLLYAENASPPDFFPAGVCSLIIAGFVCWKQRSLVSRSIALALMIACLVLYFGTLQTTTVVEQGTRFQIGFGMADWTLQPAALEWKTHKLEQHDDYSAWQLMVEKAAFDDAKLPTLWRFRKVASGLLVFLWIGFGASLGAALRAGDGLPSPVHVPPAEWHVPEPGVANLWYTYNPESDTVIVFLHGVLSDSRCWLSLRPDGQVAEYWPHLIGHDSRFQNPSIFLAGYYTDVDAGIASIRNSADEVLAALRSTDARGRLPVIRRERIIFVCHSMGGIVARYLLEANRAEFATKEIGLVLIASPSFGSELANGLGWIIDLYRHKQGQQLKWGNSFLDDLDDRFRDLLDRNQLPRLCGAEFYENKFIVPGPLFFLRWKWLPFRTRWVIVTKESAGRYFGAAKLLPNTDHFSVVKPDSIEHISHRYLYDFLVEKQLVGRVSLIDDPPKEPVRHDGGQVVTTSAAPRPLAPPRPAIRIWQDKLELLLAEEAKAVDPAAKFKIQEDIKEAQTRIDELGGSS